MKAVQNTAFTLPQKKKHFPPKRPQPPPAPHPTPPHNPTAPSPRLGGRLQLRRGRAAAALGALQRLLRRLARLGARGSGGARLRRPGARGAICALCGWWKLLALLLICLLCLLFMSVVGVYVCFVVSLFFFFFGGGRGRGEMGCLKPRLKQKNSHVLLTKSTGNLPKKYGYALEWGERKMCGLSWLFGKAIPRVASNKLACQL